MHGGARPVMYLVIFAFALGLSASAFERPGGSAATTVSEPATRLVYSGPMPALAAPVLTPGVNAPTRSGRRVANGVWVAPPIRPQPVSLPDIPDYELISKSKVATIKGQPLLADVQFGPDEPKEASEARPFMTRLPTPDLAASATDGPSFDGRQVFCGGFC